jgi:hypothetical protein
MMHGPEKSDPAIVAMKPANKAEQSAADDDYRQRKNQREPKSQAIWLSCHVCLLAPESMSICRI